MTMNPNPVDCCAGPIELMNCHSHYYIVTAALVAVAAVVAALLASCELVMQRRTLSCHVTLAPGVTTASVGPCALNWFEPLQTLISFININFNAALRSEILQQEVGAELQKPTFHHSFPCGFYTIAASRDGERCKVSWCQRISPRARAGTTLRSSHPEQPWLHRVAAPAVTRHAKKTL